MPWLGSNDVNHETPHPDRWGGWFVTAQGSAPRYAQRAHAGNITFSEGGTTSNEVFIKWLNSSPETRGYLSPSSDIVALLVFDHQMHAINLLTRLNWESRVASGSGDPAASAGGLRRLVNELADYLLFAREAPLSVPLTPRPGFAERLESRIPKDRQWSFVWPARRWSTVAAVSVQLHGVFRGVQLIAAGSEGGGVQPDHRHTVAVDPESRGTHVCRSTIGVPSSRY